MGKSSLFLLSILSLGKKNITQERQELEDKEKKAIENLRIVAEFSPIIRQQRERWKEIRREPYPYDLINIFYWYMRNISMDMEGKEGTFEEWMDATRKIEPIITELYNRAYDTDIHNF